ncbi:MAG TPA: hypothetical protein VIV11_32550 [Kofleriaceae bacterium]
MTKWLALCPLLFGCTLELSVADDGPSDTRTQVALVPTTAANDVDVLFVIDDSPSGGGDLQLAWQQAFPTFLQALGPIDLPSVHIGVVSSDLGTKGAEDAAPGPGIGSGPGSCSGVGKDAALQTSTLMTGEFIADTDSGGGNRAKNYTGTLADAFTSISSLGSSGCGIEQPLEAARRAVVNPTLGFLRPGARLAVIFLTNEDDCSFATSTLLGVDTITLGPLQSFRCTRFGVTCDEGGKTPNEMNQVGAKAKCHANNASDYMTSVEATVAQLKASKGDARNIMVGAIAGVASSIEVGLEAPPGGGTAIPALMPACTWPSTNATQIDPAVRIVDAAHAFERHYVQMPCGVDMTAPAVGLAREIRAMLGDPCLTKPIATPADCEAWDTRADGSQTRLPACSMGTAECWRFVQDASCGGQGLRLEILRTVPPPTDTMTSLRCK